jgi:spore coat polysaccharide biosynthesis protein SpsF (cytidylyltransferase family)
MKDKVLAIIQARMGSSRLPGKMLMPIVNGKGPLELMAERVMKAENIGMLGIATTDSEKDDKLAELCDKLGLPVFRGSEEDVLDRFYKAALSFGDYKTVVRLTGDCPLHDPAVIDEVIEFYNNSDCVYASNINPPTYPDGLDAEVVSMDALKQSWEQANLMSEREHVTLNIRNNPDIYPRVNLVCKEDLSGLRWTLDEEKDFEFIRAVYENFYDEKPDFNMNDILNLLKDKKDLLSLNNDITRDEGLTKSLQNDRIVK